MVMGIPTVEFQRSQKSTEVLHMKSFGGIGTKFRWFTKRTQGESLPNTSMQVTDFQDVVGG